MSDRRRSERSLREFFDHARTSKIRQFYDQYYARAQRSPAHSEFCRRVYGRDFCQHGMLDMAQLHKLMEVAALRQGSLVLDLGCGAGFITEYISETAQCRMVGIDISRAAIEQARGRTAALNKARLTFETKDIEKLDYPEHTFDAAISIDTLYFVEDLAGVVGRLTRAVKPGGKMVLFYHVAPEVGRCSDPASISPLGMALRELNLPYRTVDFTAENKEHWELRKEVLSQLREKFEEEDNMFLHDTRMDEYSQNFGEYYRFLYIVEQPSVIGASAP